MERHSCKVCGRSFPSGRSLGGHMRSHVVRSSPLEAEEKSENRYGLRENPRKSCRLDNASVEKKDKDILFPRCGKDFGLWSSLYGYVRRDSYMLKDELEEGEGKFEEGDSFNDGICGLEQEEMDCLSDSEVTAISISSRTRRRRRSRHVAVMSDTSSQPASSMDYEKEQKNGALCLLMLSRDSGSFTDFSYKAPVQMEGKQKRSQSDLSRSGLTTNELKNVAWLSCDSEDDRFQELYMKSTDSRFGRGSISSKPYSESAIHNFTKRTRYFCTICKLCFHSYQALGGHRASHKKMKDDHRYHAAPPTGEFIAQNSNHGVRSPVDSKAHVCSICGKLFSSGQALGGHKRSHSVAGTNFAPALASSYHQLIHTQHKSSSSTTSLDLNLLFPDDEWAIPKGSVEYLVGI